MNTIVSAIHWQKVNGLIPVIIQDSQSLAVLMLGYMNQEALQKTLDERKVFFFSRTKNRLWMKGETSGNILHLVHIYMDCDADTLLIHARPQGPTCHKGTPSCFEGAFPFNLKTLEHIIQQRIQSKPKPSYTTTLLEEGMQRIAQKVGEEATETIIAGLVDHHKLAEETADLLYHLLLFINANHISLDAVERVLAERHLKTNAQPS